MHKVVFFIVFTLFSSAFSLIGNQIAGDFDSYIGTPGSFNNNTKRLGVYQFLNSYLDTDRVLFWNFNTCSYKINSGCQKEDLYGISTGVGFRQLYKNTVVGVNIYHDHELSNLNINQFGLGLELLSDYSMFYLNFYLPIGKSIFDSCSQQYNDYIGDYWIYLKYRKVAAKAFEAIFSVSINQTQNIKSSFSYGIYGFSYKDYAKYFGFVGGVHIEIFKFLTINPQLYYDRILGLQVGAAIRFSYPFGRENKIQNALYKPVSRKVGNQYIDCYKYWKNY